jgi:hypothetical protein
MGENMRYFYDLFTEYPYEIKIEHNDSYWFITFSKNGEFIREEYVSLKFIPEYGFDIEDISNLELRTSNVLRELKHEEISKLAYFKWQKAGEPTGQSNKFWSDAEKEFYNKYL